MAKLIDARERFESSDEGEFRSGEVVEPGVYMDVERNTLVVMRETDELPAEMRMVRLTRRFRRFENMEAAHAFLAEQKQQPLRRAA